MKCKNINGFITCTIRNNEVMHQNVNWGRGGAGGGSAGGGSAHRIVHKTEEN